MPGNVEMAYTRERDFFAGLAVLGHQTQVLIAEEEGRVVGMGCRSLRRAFLNGQPADIGYLSGLRVLPQARRGTLLARGYRLLRDLHGDGKVPFYLTTIVEDNHTARGLLTSGRAGLPRYLDAGACIACAIPRVSRRPASSRHGIRLARGTDIPLADLVEFVNREGRRRQFFPVLEAADFGTARLKGLSRADFTVALAGDRIVGAAALWDQSGFRQHVVTRYHGFLRVARPVLDAVSRATGRPALPKPGQPLRMAVTAFLAVAEDDPAVARAILHSQRQSGAVDYIVAGLHERDPLETLLTPWARHRYVSRLYLVCWEDGETDCARLDPGLVPHVEPGML